ncbi:MAG: nuclear transport factor 2 family protein [Chloroflexi bacterium]|nr:nuclear transport factor 2 family protein [Chloroflexota bacterium]
MTTHFIHQQALAFAARLDANDFEAVKPLLAPDCRYDTTDQALTGPEAILKSYRENSEWAKATLELIDYESRVEESGEETAAVLFADHLTHHGLTHTYRCRQHLTFGPEMTIIRIEHEELPGEREKLDEFFERCGIKRGNNDSN